MVEPYAFAHITHEGFYCNRRYAAATSLAAGRLAWHLSGFVTTLVNNAGYASRNGPLDGGAD